LGDEKKAFSWTVLSYERTGLKFKITYNDPSFVSNEIADDLNIKFHDADKYLIGEDGLTVPITEVKIKMPKQMTVEALTLITTCISVVKILAVVTIVTVVLSMIMQSGAIVRIVSSFLTLELLINLGLTSYDYPDNMKFLIQFMKSFL
jgi:hypothetical protein